MKIYVLLFSLLLLILTSSFAFAIPSLQLDIKNGYYDNATQTIVSSSNSFLLYAYLISNNSNSLSDTYYISAAVVPQLSPPGANLGSFSFGSQTISVTSDMYYGVPPLETYIAFDPGDLCKHGIFLTYFKEFSFQFNQDNKSSVYDTQFNTGQGPTPDPSGPMYYAVFPIDTFLLNASYEIHFDLYNTYMKNPTDIDISKQGFAPFSHDAESGHSVPEPSALLLLGSGLLGLALYGKRKAGK